MHAEEWIEIPVPALIDEPIFARAQELLQENKVRARRRTITPSLVQGLVSCRRCGYALSRTSTRSSARLIHYYHGAHRLGAQRDEDVPPQCARRVVHLPGLRVGPAWYRTDGHSYLAAKPAKKSVAHVKHAIGLVLQPGNQAPWPEVAARLNRILRGGANYFDYGTRSTAYQAVNRYVAGAVRHFLCRRHKVPSRGTRRFAPVHVFGSFGVMWLRT